MTPTDPSSSIWSPEIESIQRAAAALKRGELVGLPTETVYGIAADALNEAAVRAIFALKGRPAENPLIVHVVNFEAATALCARVPAAARALAEAFWPGPLTLVLPKSGHVPVVTTGGLDTVAIRVPNHPVALALLAESGLPLAAPSANRFMGLSPTRASMIDPVIAAGLAGILDGGPCAVGIESTVVDLTREFPRLLRPGGITQAQLEAVIGPFHNSAQLGHPTDHSSPGQYPRHYAPRTPLILVSRLEPGQAGLLFGTPSGPDQLQMPSEPAAYAAALYAQLDRLDQLNRPVIAIEVPSDTPEWAAVWDRLRKAAHPAEPRANGPTDNGTSQS